MKYDKIDNSLFTENRRRFVQHMKPQSLAIFHSNDQMPLNADAHYPFRQNSDIFYLSGIDQEKSILVLFPDSPMPEYREVLFLLETNETIAVWEGHKYTKEEARQTSGISSVYWLSSFESVFGYMMCYAQNAYINLNENDRMNWEVPYRDLRFMNDLRFKFPAHNYERSYAILSDLRSIKAPIEVELTRKAIDITEKAFRRLLRFIKPGVTEYQIEAEIIHEFINNRATGHAYEPIIASGESACVLHYIENNKVCLDGDVILLDFGASYANYNADLTRSVPVSGRFSPRQKEVYNAVLRAHKKAFDLFSPGISLDKIRIQSGEIVQEELLTLGLITKDQVAKSTPEKPAYKKYYPHGIGHFLGLGVHDTGNRYAPIKQGMMFTVEPGIYIQEEKLGIRIENNIVVTNGKPLDLMASIPYEADEIEHLMNEGR